MLCLLEKKIYESLDEIFKCEISSNMEFYNILFKNSNIVELGDNKKY